MLSFFEHNESEVLNVEVLFKKEFKSSILSYRRDGIIHVIYKPSCIIGVEDCYKMAKYISQIGKSDKYLILTEPKEGANIETNARHLLASESGNLFTLKNAIIVDSIIHEMIGNFFIRMDKPPVPTKLFNSKSKALNWLKKDANSMLFS